MYKQYIWKKHNNSLKENTSFYEVIIKTLKYSFFFKVRWFKDGIELFDELKYNFLSAGDWYGLEIACTQPRDAGRYTVKIQSEVGYTESSCDVEMALPVCKMLEFQLNLEAAEEISTRYIQTSFYSYNLVNFYFNSWKYSRSCNVMYFSFMFQCSKSGGSQKRPRKWNFFYCTDRTQLHTVWVPACISYIHDINWVQHCFYLLWQPTPCTNDADEYRVNVSSCNTFNRFSKNSRQGL